MYYIFSCLNNRSRFIYFMKQYRYEIQWKISDCLDSMNYVQPKSRREQSRETWWFGVPKPHADRTLPLLTRLEPNFSSETEQFTKKNNQLFGAGESFNLKKKEKFLNKSVSIQELLSSGTVIYEMQKKTPRNRRFSVRELIPSSEFCRLVSCSLIDNTV